VSAFGWRHLRSVLALPVVMTIVVPTWLVWRGPPLRLGWSDTSIVRAPIIALGVAFIAAGLSLAVRTIALFAHEGDGTLAPWDPPATFVASGPYRIVRNPMISGVIAILIGESLVLGSRSVATWAAIFAFANVVYIPLLEEPMLESRFGESYREYRRTVPRWLPHVWR
jgi:protein-S-isoprenylcysteine O-methyltransferase Ste14